MVSSPMYERLKAFMTVARANQGLDAWNTDHEKVLKGFDESIQQLNAYRESHGFTGATGDAMNNWVDASIKRIEWYRDNYSRGYESYEKGREVMAQALAEAETVSPDLLDAKTAAMRDDWVVAVSDKEPGGGIEFLGKRFTTGAAYVEAVEAQANAQREASAKRILRQMNWGTSQMSQGMRIGVPPTTSELPKDIESKREGDSDNSSGGTQPIWDRTSGDGYGRNADRSPSSPNYPDGFEQPWWSEADAAAARNRIVSSGAVPTQELPYGELGSRTNPITDPQDLMGTDLLHKSVNGTAYRNGVVGGHTPAPPADAGHPLWRLNGGAASDASVAGRLGGAGVLGAGALGMRGTARMGSGVFGSGSAGASGTFGRFGGGGVGSASGSASGLSGVGRMGTAGMRGMTGGLGGAGASALKVGSYSGSGFGSYNPPAGANGLAGSGAGASGATGVAGSTGANGGAAGAAGAAGKGGSGSGFMGAGAGAGAGAGKQDKKGRKRQYVAFKFEDDEDDLPVGYVNPMSQTYGSDTTITPAKSADDGWDPRQW